MGGVRKANCKGSLLPVPGSFVWCSVPNDLNLQRLKLAVVLPGLKGCLLPMLGALAANPFAVGYMVCSVPSMPWSCPDACSRDWAKKAIAMHQWPSCLCRLGLLTRKRNEIISLLLPLQVAFLFSFQTTYCPRSPANSRERTDNAAAINKAALLHIHINQTSNSTIFI